MIIGQNACVAHRMDLKLSDQMIFQSCQAYKGETWLTHEVTIINLRM